MQIKADFEQECRKKNEKYDVEGRTTSEMLAFIKRKESFL